MECIRGKPDFYVRSSNGCLNEKKMHEKKSQHKKGIILSELALRNIHKFSITDSLGLEKISQQTMPF